MTENARTFIKELHEHCNRLGKYKFDFSVEMWGVMWTPWYVYIDRESVRFSINEIQSADLQALVDSQELKLIKEFPLEKLDDLEIERTKYMLWSCRI